MVTIITHTWDSSIVYLGYFYRVVIVFDNTHQNNPGQYIIVRSLVNIHGIVLQWCKYDNIQYLFRMLFSCHDDETGIGGNPSTKSPVGSWSVDMFCWVKHRCRLKHELKQKTSTKGRLYSKLYSLCVSRSLYHITSSNYLQLGFFFKGLQKSH